jgi:predicted nucleic acid-binding protein
MIPRFYIDTSILGGCFDREFAEASLALFEMVNKEEVIFVISDLLVDELIDAPENIRSLLKTLPVASTERLTYSPEAIQLRDAYLKSNVVGQKSKDDAHHVALATIAKVDYIISWNFKHIVHVEKIRAFNSVNLALGYHLIDIRSPWEVI